SLDDTTLFHAIDTWRRAADPILSDLSQRLHARRLFKTHELHVVDRKSEHTELLMNIAAEAAREHGFDPRYYVGLDEATFVPFDDRHDPLRVVFPDGRSYAPTDVSFVLSRLNRETLERTRLIMPPEIRDAWLERATWVLCQSPQ